MNQEIVKNDEDFRRQQQERILKSQENMGDGLKEVGKYIKETKKYQKLSMYVGIIFSIILLGIIAGGIIVSYQNGGMDSIFDKKAASRRLYCDNGDILRTYQEAYYYKLINNESCIYKPK